MKQNLIREWVTTILGTVIMTIGVAMIFVNVFIDKFNFTITEIGLTLVIGWIFLMAKNELIEQILGNKFNLPKKLTDKK